MAFKKRAADTVLPADPEQLYRTLGGGAGAPPALWVHQGDILRDWHKNYADCRDVALELPTGAGKTLVGGLVGEFRRRTRSERVLYLCLTRQLARQSHEKLASYGIPAVLLTGKVRSWNAADRARYTSGQATAVSVYSHVFNSNPALGDAQFIILDDAHAAESYVARPWSITIARDESAYHDVLSALRDAFDPLVLNRLVAESPDDPYFSSVYLASPAGVATAAGQLEGILSTAVASGGTNASVGYALHTMSSHLGRCLVYASYRSLQIRPLIAPTAMHSAFDNPTQRLYMSATLGAGGELERTFGRRHVERIEAPKGWDRQGTGRRFFCFPALTTDLSGDQDAAAAWIKEVIEEAGRVAVLTPDTRTADSFQARCLPGTTDIQHADDVEDDLEVFTTEPSAALILTNRYDGMDLPDDDCRLIVLDGLPARGDLQERFLYSALGASEVLQERIRARIAQGAGRATRNSGDYAAVVMLADDLISFCTRKDVLDAMHPELHAEMSFGLENSLGISSAEMRDNLHEFLEQTAEWRSVEVEITTDRDKLQRIDPPGALELSASATDEVTAWQAAWQGEWRRALDHARKVIDALRGGRAPQRYAALWNYLAACWCLQLEEQTGDSSFRTASAGYYQAARAAGRGTTWLSHLASPVERDIKDGATADIDPLDRSAASNIVTCVGRLSRPTRFDHDVTVARTGLLAADARPYEEALVYLGVLAGAEPSYGHGGADAAPDATWLFSSDLWVCWEAKSDARPDGELGATDVRQANSHLRYVARQRDEPTPSGSVSLVMTPQQRIHASARAVAEAHVYQVKNVDVVELFDRLVRAWRELRAKGAGTVTVDDVIMALRSADALPTQWVPVFTADPIATSGHR